MVDVARARRLAVRIREVVATTLERQVKDPRLGMVTITDARVTPDLREATVYYTVYGDAAARAESAAALESARGVLRTQVGRQTGVRFTPSLTFVADAVPEHAEHIEDLLRRAHEADARVEQARAGATYAGDPDPYRVERATDADDTEGDDGTDSDQDADDDRDADDPDAGDAADAGEENAEGAGNVVDDADGGRSDDGRSGGRPGR